MQTRTHWEKSSGAKASHGVTDWHALEVQLNRTRVILQEILLHLQEVLRNLKSVRTGCGAFAGAARGDDAGHGREARFTSAGTAGSRARAQSSHQAQAGRERFQGATTTNAHGASDRSDRFRAKPRQTVFETRAETGSRFRAGAGAGEKAKAENVWTFRSGPSASRTTGQAGATGRERPRTESSWRTQTAGQGAAGATRAGQTNFSQRTTTRTDSRSGRFRMDQDRQFKARESARKNGMNLKCAYDILCLDYPCSADEIKSAYRQMARLHHPDLGGDEEAMKDVNVAYELAMRFCTGPRRASTAWAV